MKPYYEESGITIYHGDCRTLPLADGSVNCCVTSPPYWGLRDYGVEGQIGLESTPENYVSTMVEIFRELRRVLRDDGTLWLNLGDSYATGTTSERKPTQTGKHGYWENPAINKRIDGREIGLKPKDLVGIPWRVAFALQADGWYLRSDIIWHKPNPMPESVTDRPTKAHEYIFLLAKSERYYYNAEAVKEPVAPSQIGRVRADVVGGTSWNERNQHSQGGTYARGNGKHSIMDEQSPGRRMVDNVARARANGADHDAPFGDFRNKRSVWTVTTQPYPEAHFATFPEDLIKPCILAGCPPGGVVLDPFGGSGTTMQVARALGCNGVTVELNEQYCKLAAKRLSQGVLPLQEASA